MEQWPSERVPKGGIFHTHKVNFSPETQKFIQDLIRESNLSMQQRQKINYSLRSGDPLPSLFPHEMEKKAKPPAIIIRDADTSKRRQYTSIVESGAYEREKYVPKQRGLDRDFAKQHLQDIMTFGREMKNKSQPPHQSKAKDKAEKNRFDEIKEEIQERVEWLAEMEKLGSGHKYKQLIEQQIGARIREMERLKVTEEN